MVDPGNGRMLCKPLQDTIGQFHDDAVDQRQPPADASSKLAHVVGGIDPWLEGHDHARPAAPASPALQFGVQLALRDRR